MTSVAEFLTPYDPDHERRLVERQAAADAATDWSAVPQHDRPPTVADRAIDERIARREADIGRAHGAARAAQLERIAETAAEAGHREREAEQARAAETAAVRERDRLTAILTTGRGAPDEGNWADPGRMSERARLTVTVSVLIYSGAALVDASLNYLAFRVMGVSPIETAVLAAGVVLVTVLLPKQLGEMLEARRRGARRGPRRTALIVAAGTLWAAVSVFAAVVRTRFLLLPGGAGTGAPRPSLPELAGVGPWVLTLGWLAVALAVGLVVLVHAMRRYNPYLRPWRDAGRRAARGHTGTVARRWESDRVTERLRAARAGLAALDGERDRAVETCRAFAGELKQVYRAAYLRALGAPEHRRPDDAPPALEQS
ncbi:hypothetical protein GCM10009613_08060 [Pseudonocardia kongjuensis]|uniref:Integral membrane protein n=1 Tax=Pseudonocardia kongjuensis TaxID=102227 RepID=A0ABN1XJ51_9PSEU